jgi:hypothetical protein
MVQRRSPMVGDGEWGAGAELRRTETQRAEDADSARTKTPERRGALSGG